jgi:hypothetical protein
MQRAVVPPGEACEMPLINRLVFANPHNGNASDGKQQKGLQYRLERQTHA